MMEEAMLVKFTEEQLRDIARRCGSASSTAIEALKVMDASHEKMDFDADRRPADPFLRLVLGSPSDKISDLVSRPGYDSSDLEVELRINGLLLRRNTFAELMSSWGTKMEEGLKQDLDYMQHESAIEARAEQMLRDRLQNIGMALDDLESTLLAAFWSSARSPRKES